MNAKFLTPDLQKRFRTACFQCHQKTFGVYVLDDQILCHRCYQKIKATQRRDKPHPDQMSLFDDDKKQKKRHQELARLRAISAKKTLSLGR